MVLVESGFNSEQVSLQDPFTLKKRMMHFGIETSGLNSKGGLTFEWS